MRYVCMYVCIVLCGQTRIGSRSACIVVVVVGVGIGIGIGMIVTPNGERSPNIGIRRRQLNSLLRLVRTSIVMLNDIHRP